MKNTLKKLGKGFLFGLRHPFTDDVTERHKDMSTLDALLDDAGMILPQTVITTAYGVVGSVILLCALGYLSSKLEEKTSLKVKMVVDK